MFKFSYYSLLFSLLPLLIFSQDSSSRIANVGYGVFVIGFGTVISILICLCGRATRYPEFFFLFSLIIPIFLILFFVLAPKEAQRAQNDQEEFQTDGYLVPRYIYLVIFIITFMLSGFLVFRLRYFQGLFAVRVGTVNQEDKDNFFDNEAQKPEEEKEFMEKEFKEKNYDKGSSGFEAGKSKDLGEFNARSENASFVQDRTRNKGNFFTKKANRGKELEIQE